MNGCRRTVAACVLALSSAAIGAEEIDEFSRANCFNNESISYDLFAPAWRGGVISHHFDTENGNAVHFVGHTAPIRCYGNQTNCPSTCTPQMQCIWPPITSNRMAAIHNVEDSVPVPGVTTRWRTKGYHNHTIPAPFPFPVYYVVETEAVDCNLRPKQFY